MVSWRLQPYIAQQHTCTTQNNKLLKKIAQFHNIQVKKYLIGYLKHIKKLIT
jgi:hypothetical protein